jgi:opacity protein-like surface antigen
MTRWMWLAITASLALALPATAETYPLGVSAYGGFDYPVLQSDVGSGPMWAVAVRGNIWRSFHGQIILHGTSQGDQDETLDFGNGQSETLTYKGGTLTGFGVNLLIAKQDPVNVWPYAMLGLSTNKLKFGDSFKDSKSLTGWSLGGGLGINLYRRWIYLDVNTALLVMPFHDNKASRKNWQSLMGVQYFIPIKVR